METILHMGPPSYDAAAGDGAGGAAPRAPQLSPPPYVHHSGSYSLVKQLEGEGGRGPRRSRR